MERRTFIKNSTYLLAGLAVEPLISPMKKTPIGLQLWSIRKDMKTDPLKVLRKVAEIGYQEVEGGESYANGKFYSISPKQFKIELKSIGLSMTSGHYSIDEASLKTLTVSDSLKLAVESAKIVGNDYFIQPYVDVSKRNLEDYKRLFEAMNVVGEYCKQNNLQFAYHNHEFEFQRIGETTIYEQILESTEPSLVKMQMDLYWVHFAKQNPFYWFDKYPNRFELFHMKDLANSDKRETIEIGDGSIDFTSIIQKVGKKKKFIVELEDYKTTPLLGVEKSYNNLRKLL